MRSFNLFSAVALLAAPALSAENDYSANMPCFNDLCWTSWRCWYSRYPVYDAKVGNRCGLPDNVYTPGPDGARWNALVWGQRYEMKWKSSYTSQASGIVLEWLMFEAPGTEKPVLANETDMFLDYRGQGPERFVVALSQNISASTTTYVFEPRVSDFPNQYLNVTPFEVPRYAMERNVFRIYHPETFNPHNSSTWDLSEPFTVIREAEERMIKKAASNASKSGDKKLAIGVGVGVPVAFLVAFLVSWYTSAWFQRRSLEKKGFLLTPARLD